MFKKHPLQNRTNVQIKGRGVKGLLNNVKKNCNFLKRWLPLSISVDYIYDFSPIISIEIFISGCPVDNVH